MYNRIFGIAATSKQRHNLIANLVAFDAFAKRNNIPRNLKPRNIRCTRRWRIVSFTLKHIGAINARCTYPNQNFPCFWFRHRTLDRAQHMRATRARNFDCCHLGRQFGHHD
ncbi:hypothetical protein FQZ97_1003790 [compost metagenome]